MPVKHTQHTQKVLGTIRKKKKRASKKTTKSSEAMNQKNMTYDGKFLHWVYIWAGMGMVSSSLFSNSEKFKEQAFF